MPRDQSIPPNPSGATSAERSTVLRLHRVAETTADPLARDGIYEGLRLLVELIEGRDRRRDLLEHWDRPHDD